MTTVTDPAMKAHEFARRLLSGPDQELMVLDGFNGGGFPREINFGPVPRTISQEGEDECGDCEGMVGEEVLVIGYGCY